MMLSKIDSLAWLQKHVEEYRDHKGHASETVEDFDDFGKLGQGFSLIDELEEVDLGGK
jgi:hypothetical protein